jgi:hypothetical protein
VENEIGITASGWTCQQLDDGATEERHANDQRGYDKCGHASQEAFYVNHLP